MALNEEALVRRWKAIESIPLQNGCEAAALARFARLKRKWFVAAFAYLQSLPSAEHWWCAHRDVVWQMLELAHKKELRRNLKKKIASEVHLCVRCLIAYHQAVAFYETEYEGVEMEQFRSIDRERIVGHFEEVLNRERTLPLTNEDTSTLREVLMFPELLKNEQVMLKFVEVLRLASANVVSLSKDQRYPGIYELLFHNDAGVRKIAAELARSLGTLSSMETVRPIILEKIRQFEASELRNAEVLCCGFHSVFLLLEKEVLKNFLKDHSEMLAIILKNIGAAVDCFNYLLNSLGRDFWTTVGVSATAVCDELSVQGSAALACFPTFFENLPEDGGLRTRVLNFLFRDVPSTISDRALQVALHIVSHRYLVNTPLWEYSYIWGPPLLSAFKAAHPGASELVGNILLADAVALSTLHARANGYEKLAEIEHSELCINAEKRCESWKCYPHIWKAALVNAGTCDSSSFLRLFLSAASRLSPFYEPQAETSNEDAWVNTEIAVDCAQHLSELVHLFKRYAEVFSTFRENLVVNWVLEPAMAGSLFLLSVDSNMALRGLAIGVLQAFAQRNGFVHEIDVMCSTDEFRASLMSAIRFISGVLTTKAMELPSCLVQLFFNALKIMQDSSQRPRAFLEELAAHLWPLMQNVLTWDIEEIRRLCSSEFAKSLSDLFELICCHSTGETKDLIKKWHHNGCSPSWFSELVSWNDFSLEEKLGCEQQPEDFMSIDEEEELPDVKAQEFMAVASDDEQDARPKNKRSAAAAFGDDGTSTSKRHSGRDSRHDEAHVRHLWYRLVLGLDFFHIEEDHNKLDPVPLSFSNSAHYFRIYLPLMLEEFKADFLRVHENIKWLPTAVATLDALDNNERDEHFYTARFFLKDGNEEPFQKNDLLLLSELHIRGGADNGCHAVAKVVYRQGCKETNFADKAEQYGLTDPAVFHLQLYLSPNDSRLAAVLSSLTPGSDWHFAKLMTSTPYYRQCQALGAINSFPLANTILQPRRFRESFPKGVPEFPRLLHQKLKEEYNYSQVEAIQAAVGDNLTPGHKIALIQGPPGTGKTSTIIGIISALTQCAKRGDPDKKAKILICAQSNTAVDEIVSRIQKWGLYDFVGKPYQPFMVRLGLPKAIHRDAMGIHIDRLVEKRHASANGCDPEPLRVQLDDVSREMDELKKKCYAAVERRRLPEDVDGMLQTLDDLQRQQKDLIEELLSGRYQRQEYESLSHEIRKNHRNQIIKDADIILTTLNTCGGDLHATFMENNSLSFDAVVVDEAAQALEPTTMIPLQLLRGVQGRCVLVGDPNQLPATVLSQSASNSCFELSMFERFQRSGYPVSMLNIQYRMHPEIRKFPSFHFYENKLRDGYSVIGANRHAEYHKERMFGPYMFFDVSEGKESRDRSQQSLRNLEEADVAVEIFQSLRNRYNLESTEVAVISPYKQQCKLLRERFHAVFGRDLQKVEFGTVDGFQGREVDIVILSTVRVSSRNRGNIGFVADIRRMNVALTRARFSLWLVGNARTLEVNSDWAALINDAKARGLLTTVTKPYSRQFVAPRSAYQ